MYALEDVENIRSWMYPVWSSVDEVFSVVHQLPALCSGGGVEVRDTVGGGAAVTENLSTSNWKSECMYVWLSFMSVLTIYCL